MRRIAGFITATGLVLALATGVLWWRSTRQWDELSFLRQRRYFVLSAGSSIRLGIETRRTNLAHSPTLVADFYSPTWVIFPAHGAYVPEKPTSGFGSAEIGRASIARGHIEDFTQRIIYFPHWLVMVILCLPMLARSIARVCRRPAAYPAAPFDCMPRDAETSASHEVPTPEISPAAEAHPQVLAIELPKPAEPPAPAIETPAVIEPEPATVEVSAVPQAAAPSNTEQTQTRIVESLPEVQSPVQIDPPAQVSPAVKAEPAPPAEPEPAVEKPVETFPVYARILEEQDHTFVELRECESDESWRRAVLEIMQQLSAQAVPPSWRDFSAGAIVEHSNRRFLSLRCPVGSVTPLLYNYADKNTLPRGVMILVRKRGNGRMAHLWIDGVKSMFNASELGPVASSQPLRVVSVDQTV